MSASERFEKLKNTPGTIAGMLGQRNPPAILNVFGENKVHANIMKRVLEIAVIAGTESFKMQGNDMTIHVLVGKETIVACEVHKTHDLNKSIVRTLRKVVA